MLVLLTINVRKSIISPLCFPPMCPIPTHFDVWSQKLYHHCRMDCSIHLHVYPLFEIITYILRKKEVENWACLFLTSESCKKSIFQFILSPLRFSAASARYSIICLLRPSMGPTYIAGFHKIRNTEGRTIYPKIHTYVS